MKILIDADGCPVVTIAATISKQHKKECIIISDTAHQISLEGVKSIVVSKGADSVDFALVNLLKRGDIVITQDYGLAAMCIAMGAIPVSQNGMIFNDDSIEGLLMPRHISKKVRAAGGKLKSQKKRTKNQDEAFKACLLELLKKEIDPNDKENTAKD